MSHSSSSVSGLRLSLRTASPPASPLPVNPPSTSTPLPSARMYSLYLFYEKTCKINTSCTGIACTKNTRFFRKNWYMVRPQKKGHKKHTAKQIVGGLLSQQKKGHKKKRSKRKKYSLFSPCICSPPIIPLRTETDYRYGTGH